MSKLTEQILNIGWNYPHPGGLDEIDIDSLNILVEKIAKDNIQIADIGCWTGLSTITLALASKKYNSKVIAIDWFKGSEGTGLFDSAKEVDIKSIFEANVRYFNLDNIELWAMSSEEASKKAQNDFFDLIFLDADHRYYEVCKDIEFWLPKVKKNGIFCGHDCEFILKKPVRVEHPDMRDMFKDSKHNPWNDCVDLDFHIGVVRAVSKYFPNAQIEGKRIWWIQK